MLDPFVTKIVADVMTASRARPLCRLSFACKHPCSQTALVHAQEEFLGEGLDIGVLQELQKARLQPFCVEV